MVNHSRRRALKLLAASCLLPAGMPAFAEGVTGRKFVFILLRGAMDGLSALIPDDRHIDALRGDILPTKSKRLAISNGFDLHPSLSQLHTLFHHGEAAFVHAAATSYRDRSHFDGQDHLELLGGNASADGWLNRMLTSMGKKGLAVETSIPLALQGRAPVSSWSPRVFEPVPDDLLDRLARLYEGDKSLEQNLQEARTALRESGSRMEMGKSRRAAYGYGARFQAAGSLMAIEGGPGVAMISLSGWDTHSKQATHLNHRFEELSRALSVLKLELGDEWRNTAIVICSEFGRTAGVNGTLGTDHGTGGLVILAGGAIAGGKIYGDWPGTDPRSLYQGRDLAPANAVESILKGVLRDHLGVDKSALDAQILPGSGPPMERLIKAS